MLTAVNGGVGVWSLEQPDDHGEVGALVQGGHQDPEQEDQAGLLLGQDGLLSHPASLCVEITPHWIFKLNLLLHSLHLLLFYL